MMNDDSQAATASAPSTAMKWVMRCVIVFCVVFFFTLPPLVSEPPYPKREPWPSSIVLIIGVVFWIVCFLQVVRAWTSKRNDSWVAQNIWATFVLLFYLGALYFAQMFIREFWRRFF